MAIDLTDPATFDQWREQFTNALSGCVSDASTGYSARMVDQADKVAQQAVELIQSRAAERRPLT